MKREETTNPFCFAKRVCDPAKLLNHEMLDLPVSSLSEALDELAIFVRCSLPDALGCTSVPLRRPRYSR